MKNNLNGYKTVILERKVNRMRGGFQGRSLSCRNMEGEILTNNIDVLKRLIWREGG
jgi:hypothetical protein